MFTVADQPTRQVGSHTVYFCCAACAGYFDEHQAEVAQARGWKAQAL